MLQQCKPMKRPLIVMLQTLTNQNIKWAWPKLEAFTYLHTWKRKQELVIAPSVEFVASKNATTRLVLVDVLLLLHYTLLKMSASISFISHHKRMRSLPPQQ